MREYLFTELITQQWKSFITMLLSGGGVGALYRNIRMYVLNRMGSKFLSAFLELLYFVIAALFTGGVVDYCCNSLITAYMIAGFLIGVLVSGRITGKRQSEEEI